jgi:hypothetical protein
MTLHFGPSRRTLPPDVLATLGRCPAAGPLRNLAARVLRGKKTGATSSQACIPHNITMFAQLLDIDLQTDYAAPYEANRAAYLADAEALKKATGPYKAARDAYVAATATFTKSLYE